jgi:uncharacterized protein
MLLHEKNRQCLLLFLKYPERGKVKSRLAKDLNKDITLLLYKNFILDLLDTLKKGKFRVKICFHPPDSKEKVTDWLGNNYVYMPQIGEDLGERMKNAFTTVYSEGFSKAVLIGSDIPDLNDTVLDEASECDDHDAVIGPASDGGYYLIGFQNNTFLPEIFDGIQWGSGTVFKKTIGILKKNNRKVHILPEWQDIDRLDDLRALFDRNRDTEFAHSRTMVFLSANSKTIFK